jgi:hypothetical protein
VIAWLVVVVQDLSSSLKSVCSKADMRPFRLITRRPARPSWSSEPTLLGTTAIATNPWDPKRMC